MMLRRTMAVAMGGLAMTVFLLGGCSSAGIALRESFGIEKREQLVDRVKEARDGQEAARGGSSGPPWMSFWS